MSLTKEQADSYLIRNDGEWARIFIQQGQRSDGGWWGYISVISGFGNFGHCFSHCGCEFRRFLVGLGRDYLMGKFFGAQLRVFDADTATRDLKRLLIERRQQSSVDKEKAREMWDALIVAHDNGYHTSEGFYSAICERWGSKFYDWEAWSIGGKAMNPQAVGFWDEIWPLFVAQIKGEIQAEAAAA